jgi:GTP cyclohydrolase IA
MENLILKNEEEVLEKINKVEKAYANLMDVLFNPQWREDPNSKDTPKRVAKMLVKEIYSGLFSLPPKITAFKNKGKYDGIVFEGNIEIKSMCSHHHMPFKGVAYIAYIPKEESNIIGLSKLNRVSDYISRKPQVQENLTIEIHNFLEKTIGNNKGIAVMLKCEHSCVSHRGVNQKSTMITSKLSGAFIDNNNLARNEFYQFIERLK